MDYVFTNGKVRLFIHNRDLMPHFNTDSLWTMGEEVIKSFAKRIGGQDLDALLQVSGILSRYALAEGTEALRTGNTSAIKVKGGYVLYTDGGYGLNVFCEDREVCKDVIHDYELSVGDICSFE